jgi:hypothetical protein
MPKMAPIAITPGGCCINAKPRPQNGCSISSVFAHSISRKRSVGALYERALSFVSWRIARS